MERTLEVALAMASAFLFLSVIVLALVEAVSGSLAWRSKTLARGLVRVLDHASGAEARARVKIIEQTVSGAGDAQTPASSKVLMHPLLQALGRASGHPLPSYVPTALFARAFLDVYADVRATAAESKEKYAALVGQLTPKERDLLEAVIGDVSAKAEDAQKRVEAWFDGVMDRVSGVYKRHTQLASRAFAALLVVGLNVDAVALVSNLWRDPTARASAVEVAKREASSCDPLDCRAIVERAVNDSSIVPPLGWSETAWARFSLGTASGWLAVLGWVLSICAVSLGAPFWLDKRLAPGIRQSGPKPAEGK